MNSRIMFLGGGRRVSLAKRFIDLGFDIYSYELDKKSPISAVAKVIQGVPWGQLKNTGFQGTPTLQNVGLDIVKAVIQNKIDLVLPLDDCAAAIIPQIPLPPEMCPSCHFTGAYNGFDKLQLESTFLNEDFYPRVQIGEGYVTKPRFGNSSIGVVFYDNYSHDSCGLDGYISQRLIKGTEYSVDAYFDKSGVMVGYIPRIRLRVAGGEVIDSITKFEPELESILESINARIGLKGPVCIQFIKEESSGQWFLLEINSRFGGGSILSIEAGLNMPKYIRDEYLWNSQIKKPVFLKYDLLMRRYNQEVFYEDSI